MKNADLNLSSVTNQFGRVTAKVWSYRTFIFFLLIASFYGYIVWRINVYSNALPSESEKTAQAVPQPRVDPETVKKIQSLQDNSVSVQSLFDSARQNPFQE